MCNLISRMSVTLYFPTGNEYWMWRPNIIVITGKARWWLVINHCSGHLANSTKTDSLETWKRSRHSQLLTRKHTHTRRLFRDRRHDVKHCAVMRLDSYHAPQMSTSGQPPSNAKRWSDPASGPKHKLFAHVMWTPGSLYNQYTTSGPVDTWPHTCKSNYRVTLIVKSSRWCDHFAAG